MKAWFQRKWMLYCVMWGILTHNEELSNHALDKFVRRRLKDLGFVSKSPVV